MHVNLRNATLLVLLSAAAVATWLIGRAPTPESTRTPIPGSQPLGYYLRNATWFDTNADGQVRYRVVAAQIKQSSRDQALQFERLRVDYAPETGVRWSMTAERGSTPGDRSYLELERGVRLTNVPDDGDPVTIETEMMRLNPDTFVASSDHRVAMRWGNAGLESTGFKADLKQDLLEFESDVSVRFPP